MGMSFQPLALVPAAREVLEQVESDLRQKGETASVQLPGDPAVHAYDVMKGITFLDHGMRVKGLDCVACTNGHTLRYEFRITALDGTEIGPVGSSCIFKRVLGQEQATSIGKRLEDGVKAFQRESFRRAQEHLRQEAGTWRDYLRAQGFDWVLLALAGDGYLEPKLKEALRKAQDKDLLLTEAQVRALQAASGVRAARISAAHMPVPAPPPAVVQAADRPSAFQAQDPGSTAPMGGGRRARPGVSPRMGPKEWQQYVIHNRLTTAIQYWEGVEEKLPFDDDVRQEIKETLDGHRALRAEHQVAVVRACKETTVPHDRSPTYLDAQARKEAAKKHQEEQSQRRRADYQAYLNARQRHLESLNEECKAATGKGLIDINATPLRGTQREHIARIAATLNRDQSARVREHLQFWKIRPDDLAPLVAMLPITYNPQPDPARRTVDGFKEYLGFLVNGDRVQHLIRGLPGLLQSPDFESIFAEPLEQYRSGLAVSTARLLRLVEAAQVVLRPSPAPVRPKREPVRGSSSLVKTGTQTVVLSEKERQEFLERWGRGLAEVVPQAERKALRRALQQGTPVPAAAAKAMRDACPPGPRPAKPRPSAPAAPAPKPVREAQEVSTAPRTPTEFTTRLCRLLEHAERHELRIALVKQPLSWAARSFPSEFMEFDGHGGIDPGLIDRLASKLRVT